MTVLDLLRSSPRYLAFGFLHFFFSIVGQTVFISLFVERMTEGLGWGEQTFAGIYSGVTLAAAFSLPFVGTWVDRLRVRYVSTAAAAVLVVGLVTLGAARDPWLLIPALFVVRLGGQGVLPLIGSTAIGRYFTEGRSKALSASLIGISAAEVVVPPLAVWGMGRLGYGPVWWLAAAAVVAVFLPAVWLLVRRRDAFQRADTVARQLAASSPSETGGRSWSRAEVLADPRFYLLLPALILIPFLFTGLVFNQAILTEQRGYTATLFALGLSTYGATRVVCLLLAGVAADRVGVLRLLRFVHLPALLALACLIVIGDSWSVPAFFGLAALTAGVESVIWPALWAERYGPRYLGSIKSMIRVVVVFASATAPIAFSLGMNWNARAWLTLVLAYGVTAWVGVLLADRVSPASVR